MKQTAIISTIAIILFSCNKQDEKVNYTEFTSSVYTEIIIPVHYDLTVESNNFSSSINDLKNNLNENALNEARTSWKKLYKSYTSTVLFNIDNIKDNYAHVYLQKFPTDTIKVISNLNTDPSNLLIASNSKGLSAMEYLLFRKGALDSLQNNLKNLSFLNALSSEFNEKSNNLMELWNVNNSKYTNNKGSNSDNALNQLINGMIQFTENLKMLKLGNPMGKQSFNHTNIYLSQAPFSNEVKIGLKEDVNLLYKIWSGEKLNTLKSTTPLKDLIKDKNEEVYQAINKKFTDVLTALELLPENINEAFKNESITIQEFYDSVSQLYSLIKVDLSAQLDVTVFISDLDGD